MINKFRNLLVFNIFFARTISKLIQFTPLSSTNIPSKKELLIIGAKFLAIYCASIPRSSLVAPSTLMVSSHWAPTRPCNIQHAREPPCYTATQVVAALATFIYSHRLLCICSVLIFTEFDKILFLFAFSNTCACASGIT